MELEPQEKFVAHFSNSVSKVKKHFFSKTNQSILINQSIKMTLLNMAALEDDAFHTKDLMKDTANLLETEHSGNYNVFYVSVKF